MSQAKPMATCETSQFVRDPGVQTTGTLASFGWQLTRVGAREIDISYAGGFTAAAYAAGVRDWLTELRPTTLVGVDASSAALAGENTFVQIAGSDIEAFASSLRVAFSVDATTRATVVCREDERARWVESIGSAARVEVCLSLGGQGSVGGMPASALLVGVDRAVAVSIGERSCPVGETLDYDLVEQGMDPRDRGIGSLPKAWKRAVAFTPYRRPDASRWTGKGFPDHVIQTMTDGVVIEPFEAKSGHEAIVGGSGAGAANKETRVPGRFVDEFGREHRFAVEPGQYAYPDAEHFMQGVSECDRALLVGHLEPVPAHLVDWALSIAPAHPWTIVHQSDDKWRAAQDYSQYTNPRVGGAPFTLPAWSDATKVVKPTSRFAKYDLRDGFWGVPVAASSRPHLMVRHPATGRLLWCTSLPFGYRLSPLVFCGITEAVAQVCRRRVAGLGVHIFVFVDDFLLVGRVGSSCRC